MKTLTSILAILDPYSHPQHGLSRAIEIARQTNARITLAICDNNENFVRSMSAGGDPEDRHSRDMELRIRDWLEEQAARARDAGIEVETTLVWHSPKYESILQLADDSGADLIVKAASDHSVVERLLIGATDWELIRRSAKPLWLVKTTAPVAARNWLVAVDPAHPDEKHLGLDERLLHTGRMLAKPLEASLRVFHATPIDSISLALGGVGAGFPVTNPQPGASTRLLAERKETLMSLARAHDINEEFVYVCSGDTTTELDRLVDELDIALVVAGAVSRGKLEQFMIGNSAESFLNKVDCDLLVVKPESFRAPE
jgi:universal stress protein E